MAKKKKKTDKMIKLKDLVHTIKVDDKKAGKVDAKIGAENDLAIEKDKKGRDVFAVGLTEAFQPGDMWSNDFDYIGMLKYGASLQIPNDPNELLGMIDTLNLLFDSFEDVNYHRESQDLGNAIEYIEDSRGIEDLEKAQDFLERFKKKCMSTLDVMKVKWTPKG
jgi:hypothetical protein|tara:strand:- start:275 stop:766 length:492 start_codon:yes stop_codon:yes gene_type:complete